MRVVIFQSSPRAGGNTDLLLDVAVGAIKEAGVQMTIFKPHMMDIAPCSNCGGCDDTGVCVVNDDMAEVYRAIYEGDKFILASPVFFFGLPAQVKCLIDRTQALWCEKYLLNRPIAETEHVREGLVILVGGMKKEVGFNSAAATATAFFRTISVGKHHNLFFTGIDKKGAIKSHPTAYNDVHAATVKLIGG
ncbi:MAG: flavodoxin family protein [Nitrospirae bacterium]|uniref:flavodoxin family protein n=1 Tax=Candidatus Magnetobacterium casense TaxID=1455061 RepID=UPI0006974E51|nr:flavodoxin family protein [Candidatus Magnetobacterium casensis]MBF0336699.1 flavodoxin family protein [Nitrospirota bacterium]